MPKINKQEGRRINRRKSTIQSSFPLKLPPRSSRCLCLVVTLMGIFSMFQKKSVSGIAPNAMADGAASFVRSGSVPGSTLSTASSSSMLENRLRGALWGFLAGDALASPTHWYYGGKRQIIQDYGNAITDYTKPHKQLAGSILNKSDLNGGGRSKGSNGKSFDKTIIGDVINHGKQDLWSPQKSIHYHATLQKGENTLEVSIARVLMRSIVQTGGVFDAEHFRNAYVKFMTTPGSHNDTYASTCHRMFFANMIFRQLPPKDCPDNDQHNVDTMDGLVLPTIVALSGIRNINSIDPASIEQAAADCASVTRRSSVLEKVSSQWAKVVVSAVTETNDDAFHQSLNEFSRQTIRRLPNPQVNDDSTMSACYLSSALPGLIDMTAKYLPSGASNGGERVWEGLLANANVGGENVHRGSVLGAVLGARAGATQLPPHMIEGLYPHDELAKEIDDFVRVVLPEAGPSTTTEVSGEQQ
ncbi:ADP-ribosylglycohydrolase-domain containing protein [Nitzschia inconspicua]|uniref:ADP-ribosylglycohydrolase-domain containing protein n=1 Tax=Nitzschia inconspicua TaxID=303405 RepID=A0A9K3LTU8_9STRA|nr:ADP-ribosylglycohydrolase-domain containing protein [Nitzschia inconspicua]